MTRGKIIILSVSFPRQGWGEKLRLMAESGDDGMIDDSTGEQTQWDKDEWEW